MKTVEDLQKEILKANWIDMRIHVEKGHVLLVDSALDLALVGFSLALDRVSVLEQWLFKGEIVKLSDPNRFEKEHLVSMLIVSPFVLIQEDKK